MVTTSLASGPFGLTVRPATFGPLAPLSQVSALAATYSVTAGGSFLLSPRRGGVLVSLGSEEKFKLTL